VSLWTYDQSGRRDLNPRPPEPHYGTAGAARLQLAASCWENTAWMPVNPLVEAAFCRRIAARRVALTLQRPSSPSSRLVAARCSPNPARAAIGRLTRGHGRRQPPSRCSVALFRDQRRDAPKLSGLSHTRQQQLAELLGVREVRARLAGARCVAQPSQVACNSWSPQRNSNVADERLDVVLGERHLLLGKDSRQRVVGAAGEQPDRRTAARCSGRGFVTGSKHIAPLNHPGLTVFGEAPAARAAVVSHQRLFPYSKPYSRL
jgi:hypothetical protein